MPTSSSGPRSARSSSARTPAGARARARAKPPRPEPRPGAGPDPAPPVYLDYAATTPVDPRVVAVMGRYLGAGGAFGNPASRSHGYGAEAARAIALAREQVAALISADPAEIVWTSGATEANNLALKGAAEHHARRGRHIVTCKTEHRSVLDPCAWLVRRGHRVTYLDPDPDGSLPVERVEAALRDDTVLVSLQWVNNETGVIHDIAAMGRATRARGVLLHVDAAQAAGRVPMDMARAEVDLMSLSAHKAYGPKGAGALYRRRFPKARIEPQIHGGGHERGLRSGTLATHQIAGMGEAFAIAGREMAADNDRIGRLRDRLWRALAGQESVYRNGRPDRCVAGILNLSFGYADGESLLLALRDLALSSGSACSSADDQPSHVLRAMGRAPRLAGASLRFSLGRFTTEAEVDHAARRVRDELARLRAISPLWQERGAREVPPG